VKEREKRGEEREREREREKVSESKNEIKRGERERERERKRERRKRDDENTVKQNVSLGAISSRGTELRNAIKIASFHPRTHRRYPREFENERDCTSFD